MNRTNRVFIVAIMIDIDLWVDVGDLRLASFDHELSGCIRVRFRHKVIVQSYKNDFNFPLKFTILIIELHLDFAVRFIVA